MGISVEWPAHPPLVGGGGVSPSVLPVGTMPPLPLVHPTFGTGPMFYMPPIALIRRPDDILSSP